MMYTLIMRNIISHILKKRKKYSMKLCSWPAGQQKREIYRFEIDDYISSSIIVLVESILPSDGNIALGLFFRPTDKSRNLFFGLFVRREGKYVYNCNKREGIHFHLTVAQAIKGETSIII